MELHITGLPGTQHFPGAAYLEILFGHFKAVIGLAHYLQPRSTVAGDRCLIQNAVAALAAPDPSAQLVQLGERFSIIRLALGTSTPTSMTVVATTGRFHRP